MTDEPDLELKCVVYNINRGYNEDMKKNCEAIRGYMTFVDKVREYNEEDNSAKDAVEQAIQYCIDNYVLRKFFIENREEVSKMAIIDMTWEKLEPIIRKEEFEEGRLEGIDEKAIQVYKNCLERGLSKEDAIEISGITEEQL